MDTASLNCIQSNNPCMIVMWHAWIGKLGGLTSDLNRTEMSVGNQRVFSPVNKYRKLTWEKREADNPTSSGETENALNPVEKIYAGLHQHSRSWFEVLRRSATWPKMNPHQPSTEPSLNSWCLCYCQSPISIAAQALSLDPGRK
jgi:hypothetical protein